MLISMYLQLNMNDPAQGNQAAWYIFLKYSTPDQECSYKWKFIRMVCISQAKIEQQVLGNLGDWYIFPNYSTTEQE